MEYEINAFTERLRELMYKKFPYEGEALKMMKHKKTPFHIRDIAFMWLPTFGSENSITFDIGSEYAEENYPYYHILEDAPYIRKRNRGSDKTRGSQAKVENLGKRDYGRISFNGKTYSYEYKKNVRGSRNRLDKVSRTVVDYMGNNIRLNRDANSYLNIHYQYIENMLNNGIVDLLATEFGLIRKRTQITSLEDEYNAQHEQDILDMISSFMEE